MRRLQLEIKYDQILFGSWNHFWTFQRMNGNLVFVRGRHYPYFPDIEFQGVACSRRKSLGTRCKCTVFWWAHNKPRRVWPMPSNDFTSPVWWVILFPHWRVRKQLQQLVSLSVCKRGNTLFLSLTRALVLSLRQRGFRRLTLDCFFSFSLMTFEIRLVGFLEILDYNDK